MMCQRIGLIPISTIGLGFRSVSSRKRVPRPPQRITTFIATPQPVAARVRGVLTGLSRDVQLVAPRGRAVHSGPSAAARLRLVDREAPLARGSAQAAQDLAAIPRARSGRGVEPRRHVAE